MRGVIWLVLLFAAAVLVATALGQNDGLVTLSWGQWQLALSLNLSLLLLLLAGLAVWGIARALDALLSLPRRAKEWRSLQRERAAHAAFREALGHYFGGRFNRCQKAARRALSLNQTHPELALESDHHALSMLLIAGSLHRLQDRAGRDAMSRQLAELPPTSANRSALDGAALLAAEWSLEDQDASSAQQHLDTLPAGVARRTQALRLRLRAARMDRRTLSALELARMLSKHQAFSSAAAMGLLRSLALEHLDAARDAEQLSRQWQQLEPADRLDTVVLSHAVKRAVSWGAYDQARAWLEPAWAQVQTAQTPERQNLGLALASAVAGAEVDWLERAEQASRLFPADAALALATAALCAERQLWGKAQQLLEGVTRQPTLPASARRQAWRTLARIAEEEGDEARLNFCMRACAETAD